MFRPISIGSIPSLCIMLASGPLITSPSLATVVSSLIDTFPASTPAFTPSCANSEMTGPGVNGVGPAVSTMSNGASWPAFAGAGVLLFFIVLYSANGFSFVNISAGIPFRLSMSFSPFSSFSSFSPSFNSVFLVITSSIFPRSCFFIFSRLLAGSPSMLTIPMIGYFLP